MNNNSNNCGGCGTTCSECGRPWAICKQDGGCGCNKCKDIKFCEYGRMANGCIREKQPGCPMQAVIPSVTVESIEGIKNLADCLVHVSDINTTFYIDDKHRPIITWAGPIDIPGYDMEGNPNNYRDQIVTDVANQIAVIYDKSGKGYMFGLVENIDLQEQVNNKLDEMAQDGSLSEIIAQFLGFGALVTVDTVADMVSSENLVKGSKVKTLGKITVDDGYGAIYEITDAATDIALNNGLYAQIKTRTYGDNYFKDIEVESSRVFDTTNETDVYYATIPVTDFDGTPINPYVGEVEEETLSPSQYARANYTTITTNAGLTQKNSSGQWKQAIVIGNGQVLNTYEAEQTPASFMRYLAFKDNRVVTDFPAATTTADMMLAQGVKNAFLVFQKVIDNGSVTIAQERDTDDVDNRMMLGVKLDGTIVIVCADGNTPRSGGLTIRECANLLLAKGCINAWEMDGGGSASLNYKGQKINHNKDSHQTIDRGIWVTLNFKRETVDKTIGDLYNHIGEVKQKLNKEIRDDIRATDNTGALYISASDGANENIVTANNAWQDANLRFRYRHNQNIITPYQTSAQSAISDPVNYCGFTAHKAGLYKINVTSCVKFRKDDQSKNSGRAIRIVNSEGQSPTVDPTEWITPDLTNNNGNVSYQICTTMMVNANTEELSFKLQVRGTKSDSYADNFQRIKMTVEYCGSASY